MARSVAELEVQASGLLLRLLLAETGGLGSDGRPSLRLVFQAQIHH